MKVKECCQEAVNDIFKKILEFQRDSVTGNKVVTIAGEELEKFKNDIWNNYKLLEYQIKEADKRSKDKKISVSK